MTPLTNRLPLKCSAPSAGLPAQPNPRGRFGRGAMPPSECPTWPLPVALEDYEVVLGKGEHVAGVMIHPPHLEVPLHEGAVVLGTTDVGAALELHELAPEEGRIVIAPEDVDHHEGAAVGEETPYTPELGGKNIVGDVMEATVGHDEVEGGGCAQLGLRGDEARAAIEPTRVAHESRVDVVAHVPQARRLEGAREEPGTAAEVEGQAAARHVESAQTLQ